MTKKIVLLIIGGVLLTSSLVGALYLVKQRQETRRGAVGCNGCPDGTCESGGACISSGGHACNGTTRYTCDPSKPCGSQWVNPEPDHPDCGGSGGGDGSSGEGGCDEEGNEGTLGAGCCEDVNDGHLYCKNGLECCQGSCHNPDDAVCDAEGTSCSGSCDKNGCSNDCPSRWPVSFYCRGRSHSACGDQHSTFLGNGVPAGSIKYGESITVEKDGNETTISSWCTTVQADSNAPDGEAIVVFIGDYGDYCVEGTGCNPDNLDWDCTRPTNTPTNTPTPTPTNTPTPTATPVYECDCLTLKMYNQDWELITDYSQLKPGDEVYLLVTGETNHPLGITKARFKVNEQAWQESQQKHQGNIYWEFEIPDYGNYSVEAQVYNPGLGWR